MSLLLLLKPSGAPVAGGSVGAPASLPSLAAVLHKAYTLTAEQGSYTIAGQDAGLNAGHVLAASQGSYSASGQDISFLYGEILTAEYGEYVLDGYTTNGLYSRLMTAQQGGYDIVGQTSTQLDYSAVTDPDSPAPLPSMGLLAGLGYTPAVLTAEQGSYTLTGQDALFQRTYILASDYGVYSQSGQIVALGSSGANVRDPGPLPHIGLLLTGTGTYSLVCDPGTYSLAGSDAVLDFEVAADGGTYAITGQDAALNVGYLLTAEGGAYAVTGQNAGFSVTGSVLMLAEYGTYAITGQDAAVTRQYPMTAEQGFYALLGQQAIFWLGSRFDYVMPSDYGAYTVTGQDAGLTLGQKVLACDTGYYSCVFNFEAASPGRMKDAGRSKRTKKRERYIAKYKGKEYELGSLQEVEALIARAKAEQADVPKKRRERIKIDLAPEYQEFISPIVDIPARLTEMPPAVVMANLRKIDAIMAAVPADIETDDENDEVLLWLI